VTEDPTISVTPGRSTSTSGYTITRNKEAVTMSWRAFRIGILALAIAAGPLATLAAAQGNTIFMPLLVYRTGPYAPSGIPIANAGSDYFNLLNERDGGINGVKIVVEECETQYDTKQGVECYERLKGKGPLIVNPYSTGIAYQLVPKAAVDKVVVH
jgi:branched-chain amino acid transport system substrate-binding protein